MELKQLTNKNNKNLKTNNMKNLVTVLAVVLTLNINAQDTVKSLVLTDYNKRVNEDITLIKSNLNLFRSEVIKGRKRVLIGALIATGVSIISSRMISNGSYYAEDMVVMYGLGGIASLSFTTSGLYKINKAYNYLKF